MGIQKDSTPRCKEAKTQRELSYKFSNPYCLCVLCASVVKIFVSFVCFVVMNLSALTFHATDRHHHQQSCNRQIKHRQQHPRRQNRNLCPVARQGDAHRNQLLMVNQHLLRINGCCDWIQAGDNHIKVDISGFRHWIRADVGCDIVDDIPICTLKEDKRRHRQSDGNHHCTV